ncbi:hypothetical protein Hanom_Chr07g00647141 [Helianthus anomalus]
MKEFQGFRCMEKESLGSMAARFHHLLSEMFVYIVEASQQEMKFSKRMESWKRMSIYDFIQEFGNKHEEEVRKAKRAPIPQNPEIYYGIGANGIQGETQPTQHSGPPIAFVSNSNSAWEQLSPASLPPLRVDPYSSTPQAYYVISSNPYVDRHLTQT